MLWWWARGFIRGAALWLALGVESRPAGADEPQAQERPPAAPKPDRGHLDLTQTPGIVVGDWSLQVTLSTGTDGSQDSPRDRDQALQRDRDQREAQLRGEKIPNPIGDMLVRRRKHAARDAGFQVAAHAQRELQPTTPAAATIQDPLSGQAIPLAQGSPPTPGETAAAPARVSHHKTAERRRHAARASRREPLRPVQ